MNINIIKKYTCEVGTQTDESFILTKKPHSIINKYKYIMIFSYNLTDGDGFNKDKMLVDKNTIGIGVSLIDKNISRYGIDNYIKSISDATHIIAYKAKLHFKDSGGIFENIYEIVNGPIIIRNQNDFMKYYPLKLGIDISQQLWNGKLQWIQDPRNYGIQWNVKLVKRIIISRKDSGINIRSRFGRIHNNNPVYTCF